MSKINIFGLGGLNENGKNMYVIEVDDDIFVFEAGLQYADEHTLGIDYFIPNIDYLKELDKDYEKYFNQKSFNKKESRKNYPVEN